jgi:hypothetical protein
VQVQSGIVDAYEVTVARLRSWVNAGMPRPRVGSRYFLQYLWTDELERRVRLPDDPVMQQLPLEGRPAPQCTWDSQNGVHDDLPVNCLTAASAIAFCWWDGKHVATSSAWEFLARNRGTTVGPYQSSEQVRGTNACSLGNVGIYTRLCGDGVLPVPVGIHPMGGTLDPVGIYDLYGGVGELALGYDSPYNRADCRTSTPPNPDIPPFTEMEGYNLGSYERRGNSWYDREEWHNAFANAATRADWEGDWSTRDLAYRDGSVRQGVRCMRWLPEPRD